MVKIARVSAWVVDIFFVVVELPIGFILKIC